MALSNFTKCYSNYICSVNLVVHALFLFYNFCLPDLLDLQGLVLISIVMCLINCFVLAKVMPGSVKEKIARFCTCFVSCSIVLTHDHITSVCWLLLCVLATPSLSP